MKKTLVALAVTAFAASASAVTVYDAEGTKVEVDGSLRLVLEQASSKTKDAAGVVTAEKNGHSALRNDGSRFGFRSNHDLGDGFFALSRLEIRFNKDAVADGFGDLYAHRAYVGLGKKEFGELTFGRQLTIADDLGFATDYSYGLMPAYITTAGKQVIRYDYKGIDGLQVGANYNFGENRDSSGELLENAVKNAVGIGALYTMGNVTYELGYGRTNYVTGTSEKHYVDAVEGGVQYSVDALKVGLEAGYGVEKDGSVKTKAFYISPSFQYQVTKESKVYGNYLFERKDDNVSNDETKKHGLLLGADYKFHKNVVAYVEGKLVNTKDYSDGEYAGKVTDKAIGVGMRVFW